MRNGNTLCHKLRDGSPDLIVTQLRLLLVRIAMDEQNIARKDFHRCFETFRHCELLSEF